MDNVMFHNVGEIENKNELGIILTRVPKDIRVKLNQSARMRSLDWIGGEIRFVTESMNISLYISGIPTEEKQKVYARIYQGNFLYRTVELTTQPQLIVITPMDTFLDANDKMLNSKGFSSNVWRVISGNGTIVLHEINTHGNLIRPPFKDELPLKKFLAYGSSITQADLDGYPFVTAKLLGLDVENMGFCAGCHIEPELVDYILEKRKFDFISCEVGVNMRRHYTPTQYEERFSYLLDKLVGLGKPAIIISIFPNRFTEEYTTSQSLSAKNDIEFNKITERLISQKNSKSIYFIKGNELLTDLTGLSADLIHPTSYGHAIMAMNLAKKIKEFKIV